MSAGDNEQQHGIVTKTRAAKKLKRPPMYRVLLHNDDYTTRDFVVEVLQHVFHHNEHEAVRIMYRVHTTGIGLAGIFPYEIAEVKVHAVQQLAKRREFPLRLSIEPDDGSEETQE